MSALLTEIASQIEDLFAGDLFAVPPVDRQSRLLTLLKAELTYAIERNESFHRYVSAWPTDYRKAQRIADLPYLPAGTFKLAPPLALAAPEKISRIIASSATTGQTPSRVVLDIETSRRMVRGVTAIIRDFVGPARRPYLVVDTQDSLVSGPSIGARAAAVQALRNFATDVVCCLRRDADAQTTVDEKALLAFSRHVGDGESLAYGFTYVIWKHLVQPLRAVQMTLRLPNIKILHSGGWKRLQDQAVSPASYSTAVAELFQCNRQNVVDFYGMVENVGVIYPDCAYGNKHAPSFAEVIIRDSLTLEPIRGAGAGLIQVCSALATSFPGFAVLTDDLGEVIHDDGCPCGRRGIAFRFVKRAPRAELRGCGNIESRDRIR